MANINISKTKLMELIIKERNMIVFNKKIYYKNQFNTWVCLEDQFHNDSYKTSWLNKMINDVTFKNIDTTNLDPEGISKLLKEVKITTPQLLGTVLFEHEIKNEDMFEGIVFNNGYVDKTGWHQTDDVPFTVSQIPLSYDPSIKVTSKALKKWFRSMTKGKEDKRDWLNKYFMLLSTALSNINFEVFGIIGGKSTVGKSAMLNLIERIVGLNNVDKIGTSALFSKEGSNRFALRNIDGKSFLHIDEFPALLSVRDTDTIKTIANKGHLNMEAKMGNQSMTKNTGTWLTTTNETTKFANDDEALKLRLTYFLLGSDKGDMTQEDWTEVWDNEKETIKQLLPMLVKSFVTIYETPGTRAEKFHSEDVPKFWDEVHSEDTIVQWIVNNKQILDGQPLDSIYKEYDSHQKDFNLPNIKQQTLGKKLVNSNIFEKVRKTVNGVKSNRYYLTGNGIDNEEPK